jgi:hypothetical protein
MKKNVCDASLNDCFGALIARNALCIDDRTKGLNTATCSIEDAVMFAVNNVLIFGFFVVVTL